MEKINGQAITMLEKISQIKEIKQAGFISYEKINSGTINQNFIINTKKGKWVLRLNNPQVSGVNRKHESFILGAIKHLEIAPDIITNNIIQGYLLKEYQGQQSWSKLNCTKQQQLLVKQLTKIHTIDITNKLPNFKSRLQKYLDDSYHLLDNDFRQSHKNTVATLDELDFFSVNKLIHFDLNRHNLIGIKPLVIIDWEFAGCGHPIFDLAIFIYNQKLQLNQCEHLVSYCTSYKNGQEILNASLDLVAQMVYMWDLIKT